MILSFFFFFWRSECFGKRDGRKTQTPEASEIRVSNDSFKLRSGDNILRVEGERPFSLSTRIKSVFKFDSMGFYFMELPCRWLWHGSGWGNGCKMRVCYTL